jgi:hypothetical protein
MSSFTRHSSLTSLVRTVRCFPSFLTFESKLTFPLPFSVMKLSKRQARDALQELFPQAELASKKDLINGYIDQILSGQ